MSKRNKFDELRAYKYGVIAGTLLYVGFWVAVIGTAIHFIHKYW